jgi:hypothetical protein
VTDVCRIRVELCINCILATSVIFSLYSASHSRAAPENIGLQKEQKCNTFACHTCNDVRLCVLGIRKKEVRD